MLRRDIAFLLTLAIVLLIYWLSQDRPLAYAQSAPTRILIKTVTGLSVTSTFTTFLPIVLNVAPVPPSATTSRYIQTLDQTKLYNQGCAQGTSNPSGIVVLDFGGPRNQNGIYGTKLVGISGFVSTTQIADAVKWWLQGFWNCSPSSAHITVGIGTNNCSTASGPNTCNPGGGNVSAGHGQAWAQMVRDVNTWITNSNYNSKLLAVGANDMEPGWDSPSETRAWVDGYFSATPLVALYNYGSCDSCAFNKCPSCIPPNGWTYNDIWYVSWGAGVSYPLPEIYLTSGVNADQWYRMGVYAYTNHGSSMNFGGSFTQWQACQDVGPGACPYTANTPSQGWTQLYNLLNGDARTAQPLNWSTDITWKQ